MLSATDARNMHAVRWLTIRPPTFVPLFVVVVKVWIQPYGRTREQPVIVGRVDLEREWGLAHVGCENGQLLWDWGVGTELSDRARNRQR